MKNALKFALLCAALLLAPVLSALAQESEPKNCYFEIILNVDSQAKKSGYFLKERALNPNEIPALQELLRHEADLEKILADKSDLKRAKAFHSRMGLNDLEILACLKRDGAALVFFKSPSSKLRPDMNYLYFKNVDGKLMWDVGARSAYISVLSESIRNANVQNHADESKLLKFIDISDSKNADTPELVFYKKAQADFYDLKLEEYAKIMTPKSAEVFGRQYLNLTQKEREETLKDYITYHKSFKKIADLGEVKVILFARERDGKVNSRDAAFILKDNDGFRLANFGQDQGAFAAWLTSLIE